MEDNFLVIHLGDVDFVRALESAAQEILERNHVNRKSEDALQEYVVACCLGETMKLNATVGDDLMSGIDNTRTYLNERLSVSFEQIRPPANLEGGSVYIDLRTKTLARF